MRALAPTCTCPAGASAVAWRISWLDPFRLLVACALGELVLNRLWTGGSLPQRVHAFASALVGALAALTLLVSLVQVGRRRDVLPLGPRVLVGALGLSFLPLATAALVAPTARLQIHAELGLASFALGLFLLTLLRGSSQRSRLAAGLVTLPIVLHGWAHAAEVAPALALPIEAFGDHLVALARLGVLSCAVLLPSLLLPDLGAAGVARGGAALLALVVASWYGILHFIGHSTAGHAARALGLLPPTTMLYALVQIAAVFAFVFVATTLALSRGAARVTGTGLVLVALAGLELGDAYQLLLCAAGLLSTCAGLCGIDELA